MFDLIIIGGGPVGIFGCFYACLNNLKTLIIEIDKEIGGAPLKMYPEKFLYDIPGFAKITGADYVKELIKQLKTKNNWSLSTNTFITDIIKNDDGTFKLISSNNEIFTSKKVIITIGYGAFKFKNIKDELFDDNFDKSKMHHIIKHLDYYKNKNLVVCGGGNSALDYTNILSEHAKSIVLIHHSDKFSGLKNTLEIISNKDNVSIISNCEIVNIKNSEITLKVLDKEIYKRFDDILVFYGVESINNKFNNLLIFNESKKIEINSDFESIKIPGIYACGLCNHLKLNYLMVHGFSQISQVIDKIVKEIK